MSKALSEITRVLFVYLKFRRFGTVGVKEQDITGRDRVNKRR
jgi:hypothetical protein